MPEAFQGQGLRTPVIANGRRRRASNTTTGTSRYHR